MYSVLILSKKYSVGSLMICAVIVRNVQKKINLF